MMTERHAEPGTDVGSFLPRPGEPVGAYAERLRALHRDLTLVLEAVERGLAASAPADERGPAEPPVPWDPASDLPPPRPRRFARRGGEEASFTSSGEHEPLHHEVVDVRPVYEEPAPGEHDVGPLRSPVPVRGMGARVVVMPSGTGELERPHQERESDWRPPSDVPVERTMTPPAGPVPAEPAAWPPPAPAERSSGLSPMVLALAAAGWLTAIALILAVALGL